MRIFIIVFALLGFIAGTNYFSYDYGKSSVIAANKEANEARIEAAVVERRTMAVEESKDVIEAIEAQADRSAEVEELQRQVASYEDEIEDIRTTACNLADDTLSVLQQFADADSEREQLDDGARIPDALTTSGVKGTGIGYTQRDGRPLFREWRSVLGYCLQPDRFATRDPKTPETGGVI